MTLVKIIDIDHTFSTLAALSLAYKRD